MSTKPDDSYERAVGDGTIAPPEPTKPDPLVVESNASNYGASSAESAPELLKRIEDESGDSSAESAS
ncbi:MAG: hypothetical protein NVS4B5_11380 [Vulcanimicrobiaceae bacterium]